MRRIISKLTEPHRHKDVLTRLVTITTTITRTMHPFPTPPLQSMGDKTVSHRPAQANQYTIITTSRAHRTTTTITTMHHGATFKLHQSWQRP